MPTIEYNLDSDEDEFVQGMSRAEEALEDVEDQAQDTTRSVNRLRDGMNNASRMARSTASSFGDVVAAGAHVTEILSGGAEVVGELVGGFVELIRSAADAREEMKAFLTDGEIERLDQLATQLEAADTAGTLLQQTIATSLGPEVSKLINAVIGATTGFGDLMKAFDAVRDNEVVVAIREVADILGALATLGVNKAIWAGMDALAESGEEAAEQITEVTEREKELAQLEKEALEDIIAGKKAQADVDKAAATAAEKAAAEREKHIANIAALNGKIFDAMAAEQEKAAAAEVRYREFRFNQWKDGLTDQLDALDTYIDEVAKKLEEETKAWEEAQKKKREGTRDAVEDIASNWMALGVQLTAMQAAEQAEYLDKLQERGQRLKSQLASADALERDVIEGRIERNKKAQDEQEKAAKKAFAISQAAAIGQVLMSGAMAFAALTANLAYLTWGAPIAAAAISGPVTAGQLAVVANQKPPAHDGRAFGADEFFVGDQMVRQGELGAVFNQRAAQNGARQVVEDMNRTGLAPGGGPTTMVLADAGRVLGTALLREQRRSGSPLAVGTDGFTNPFRGRG